MKEKKRGLKRIGQAILLVILVLAALIYAPFWDTAPPDVADLAAVRVEVPPEENAYTFFLQATNSLRQIADFPLSQYLPGLTNDEAVVSATLATNQPAIAWIRLGVERRYCQLPVVEEWKPDVFSSFPMSSFLDIGKLIAAQARFERLQGRMSEATDATLLLLRYAGRLQHASGLFIDYLIAGALVSMGLTQAEDLARDPGCGVAERERLVTGLTVLGTPGPGLALAAKCESTYTADMLQQIKTGNVNPSYLYDECRWQTGNDLKLANCAT